MLIELGDIVEDINPADESDLVGTKVNDTLEAVYFGKSEEEHEEAGGDEGDSGTTFNQRKRKAAEPNIFSRIGKSDNADHNSYTRVGRADRNIFSRIGKADKKIFSRIGKADKNIYSRIGKPDKNMYSRIGKADKNMFSRIGKADTSIYSRIGKADKSIYSRIGRSYSTPNFDMDNIILSRLGKMAKLQKIQRKEDYSKTCTHLF